MARGRSRGGAPGPHPRAGLESKPGKLTSLLGGLALLKPLGLVGTGYRGVRVAGVFEYTNFAQLNGPTWGPMSISVGGASNLILEAQPPVRKLRSGGVPLGALGGAAKGPATITNHGPAHGSGSGARPAIQASHNSTFSWSKGRHASPSSYLLPRRAPHPCQVASKKLRRKA